MKKHKKRKHWSSDLLAHMARSAVPISDIEHMHLKLYERLALQALVDGTDDRANWDCLNDVQALAETMALAGVGPEALPGLAAAESALAGIAERGRPLRCLGDDLASLDQLLAWHSAQRETVPRAELYEWVDKQRSRTDAKRI